MKREKDMIHSASDEYQEAMFLLETARLFSNRSAGMTFAEPDGSSTTIHQDFDHCDEALELYESARGIFVTLGMQTKVAECDRGIADIKARGRGEECWSTNSKLSPSDGENMGMSIDDASTILNNALNYFNSGKYEEAFPLFESTRKVFAVEGMEWNVAICDANIAIIYLKIARYDEALPLFESVREVFSAQGMESNVAASDSNMAIIHRNLGHYDKALALYESAREIYASQGMEVEVAQCDRNITELQDLARRKDYCFTNSTSLSSHGKDIEIDNNDMGGNADSIFNTAVDFLTSGKYHEAFPLFESAREMFFTLRIEMKVAVCDLNIANIHYTLGHFDMAFPLFESAKEILAVKGMTRNVALCNQGMASICAKLGRFNEALPLFKSAKEIYSAQGMEMEVAACDQGLANIYTNLGRFKEALELYKSARSIFATRGMTPSVARSDMNMAIVYGHLGRFNEALHLFKSAKLSFADQGMEADVAICDMNIAAIQSKLGRLDEALTLQESAKGVFVEQGMVVDVAKCDMNIASIYECLGRFDEALALHKFAKGVFFEQGMVVDVANCDMNIASIYGCLGRFDEALALHNSAKKVFADQGMMIDVGKCEENTANAEFHLGRYGEALALHESAKGVFFEQGMVVDVAKCDMNIASIYGCLGRFDEALALHKSAKGVFFEQGMVVDVAKCDMNIAVVQQKLGHHDKALLMYKSAKKVFAKQGMAASAARCEMNIAYAQSELGRYNKALALYRQALDCDHINMETRWKCLRGEGRVLGLQGNLHAAYNKYAESIDVIEGMRAALSQDKFRTSFLGTAYHVYYDMIELCLMLNDTVMALEYVERLKSRSLAEMLAKRDFIPKNATEIETQEYRKTRQEMRALDYRMANEQNEAARSSFKAAIGELEKKHEVMVEEFRRMDSTFDPDQKVRFSCEEIRELVDDGISALVELFPMKERMAVFILKGDGAALEPIVEFADYGWEHVNEDVKKLLDLYDTCRNSDRQNREAAHRVWETSLEELLKGLHENLFLKIRPHLEGIKRLTIIPYGLLHLLPLHAMFAPENGARRYLIDDYLVTYAPSAKILKQCRERAGASKGRVVVAFANPQGTDALPYAYDEANTIRGLFINHDWLPKATRQDIIRSAEEASILHYTGHATSKALILHGEEDKTRIDCYSVEDIFATLDLPEVSLAVLSTCEAAMMINEPGAVDEYIGLTSGLLCAGAATVVASLWSVSDISTSLLMKKMYELIKVGKPKAEALRQAQLWLKNPANSMEHYATLAQGRDTPRSLFKKLLDWVKPAPKFSAPQIQLPDDLYLRPFYWAGFICSGAE